MPFFIQAGAHVFPSYNEHAVIVRNGVAFLHGSGHVKKARYEGKPKESSIHGYETKKHSTDKEERSFRVVGKTVLFDTEF